MTSPRKTYTTVQPPSRRTLERVTLETSLKPFHPFDQQSLEATADAVFQQWRSLLATARSCSLLLWVSDGSEILDWAGDPDATFEWARYIGFCNTAAHPYGEEKEPDRVAVPYREGTAPISYADLARLIAALRGAGERLGMAVRVGATFDPGPEFAPSDFKFTRHPEILAGGEEVGIGPIIRMVRHFSTLKEDGRRYAAFPDGIPPQTSFGEFLGRQSQSYLTALGFDYLWLSNGFGFSSYAWSELGESFDGARFRHERTAGLRERALGFWEDLSTHLTLPVQVRGTNQTAGIDIGSDSVPALEVYERGYVESPPPNSPWGPLNEDFGVEMSGFMSRIAMLPRADAGYRFRFYANDPWFWQQPWWDFYHREPFDIHLPLSVARLTSGGAVETPSEVNVLAIDTSRGELDERCGREVGSHVARALENAPDQAGPLVWVYPFREYHEAMAASPESISRPHFEDWYLTAAISSGLPLNTVVSTDELPGALAAGALAERVLVVPAGGLTNPVAAALTRHLEAGGSVLAYGSLAHASDAARSLLGVTSDDSGLAGDLDLASELATDSLSDGTTPVSRLRHAAHLSGGTVTETLADAVNTRVLATVRSAAKERVYATARRAPAWRGQALWVRGSAPFTYSEPDERGVRSRVPHDLTLFADVAALLRGVLGGIGIRVSHELRTFASGRVVQAIRRHEHAYWFSGYLPDTTSRLSLGLPQGAPLLNNQECWYQDGAATYQLPKSFHAECRVLVHQHAAGLLRCREIAPYPWYMARGIRVDGLADATVTLYLPPGVGTGARITAAGRQLVYEASPADGRVRLEHVTGSLNVAWPRRQEGRADE
ncbi:hypothetical protein ACXZ65_17550 [Streptomyces aculeolatus]